ncbi:MAG: murein biosynthesis integral membrane protein MurJ [Canibacter sp.]
MASSIARASAVMATGTIVSRVLGFIKAILLIQAIGQTASLSADAFANGNALPNMLYYVVLGGMLQAVLVPQIVAASKGADGGAGYINKILTLISVGMLVITALAVIAAPWLVRMLAVTWTHDQLALATAFAYWCLPQIFFYGLYSVLGEVLNARSVFGPFTWAPVLNNVIAIIGLLLFIVFFGADPSGERGVTEWTPGGIALLAGSATAGIVAQALILFVSWRRAGIHFKPDFKWRGMGLGKTVKLAGWALATVLVLQVSTLITTNIVNTASGEGPAQLAVQNAWLVFTLPHSVLAVSIATAYFTRLSEAGQTGNKEGFRKEFIASTRVIMLVMLMASAVLLAIARYASHVMQVGATTEQIDLFMFLIQAYVIGLAAYSLMFVLNRAFFALSDTRTPFVLQVLLVVVEVVLMVPCLWLPKEYTATGVALATSIATISNVIIAFWLLKRKVGDIGLSQILMSLLRMVPATVASAILGVVLVIFFQRTFPGEHVLVDIGLAVVVAGIVAAVFFAVMAVMRAPEISVIKTLVAQRLKR